MKQLVYLSALLCMMCTHAFGSNDCKTIKDNVVGIVSLFDVATVTTYYRTGNNEALNQLVLEGRIRLFKKGMQVVDVGYACKRGHWKVKLVGTTTEVWMHHSHYECN